MLGLQKSNLEEPADREGRGVGGSLIIQAPWRSPALRISGVGITFNVELQDSSVCFSEFDLCCGAACQHAGQDSTAGR